MKPAIKSFFVFLALFTLLASCSFVSEKEDSELKTARAYFTISVDSFGSTDSSRTILPNAISEHDITMISLKATVSGSSDSSDSSNNKEWNWWAYSDEGKTAFDDMRSATNLYLETGTYDFTIEIYTSISIYQKSEIKNKTLTEGENSLAFNTKFAEEGNGSFTINLTWPDEERVGQIYAGLFTEDSDGQTPVTGYELSPLYPNENRATYSRYSVPPGSYYLRFEIYSQDNSQIINILEDIIKIVPGCETTATINLSELNSVYTVTYQLDGGNWIGSYLPVTERNAHKILTLPDETMVEKLGYIFKGWFKSDDEGATLTSEAISRIGAGTASDIELWAKWEKATALYVSGDGDDLKNGLTEANALKTLGAAIQKIAEINDESIDWTIKIDGTILGTTEIADLSAKSLVIEGKTGSSTDILDGDASGTVLTIQTSVPVTIKNLTIKNGSENGGGGLFVGNGANVTIADGTLITQNNSSSNGGGVFVSLNALFTVTGGAISANEATTDGGGIYNGGTLTISGGTISDNTATNGGGIYNGGTLKMSAGTVGGNTASGEGGGVYNSGTMFMYGSAVIGDSSKTTTATESSYSNKGDGIRVIGTVYLGYSDSSTTALLTGGIFYNQGAGISILNGTAVINSGSISYNCGRGVYVGSNDYAKYGTFTMNGGTISENVITNSNGAGIYAGYHGKVSMNGGTISDNTALNGIDEEGNLTNGDGGGVAIANTLSSFTMTGGTISGNTARRNGGGFYLGSNAFTMSGGTISGNLATTGNGIYINDGTFTMSGLALISSDNDTYLASGKYITVGSTLSESTAATIHPASYTEGNSAISLASGSSTTLDKEYYKFAIASESDGTEWGLNSEGKLQKQKTLNPSDTANITDPSIPYIIKGSSSVNNAQIDINNNVTTSTDSTYYITLDNVKRNATQWASALIIYNRNAGTTVTVYITLIGENKLVGYNHGGLKLSGTSGANINVIFLTPSSGSISFDDSYSGSDLRIENVTGTFSIASDCSFSGTSGGTIYPDFNSFFNAAQTSTSGSSFTLTK